MEPSVAENKSRDTARGSATDISSSDDDMLLCYCTMEYGYYNVYYSVRSPNDDKQG